MNTEMKLESLRKLIREAISPDLERSNDQLGNIIRKLDVISDSVLANESFTAAAAGAEVMPKTIYLLSQIANISEKMALVTRRAIGSAKKAV